MILLSEDLYDTSGTLLDRGFLEMMQKIRAHFRDLPVSLKLLLSYSSVFVLAMLLGGVVIYSLVYNAIEANIENELGNATATILNMVRTAANMSIKNHLRAAAEKNLEIIQHLHDQQKAGRMTEAEAKALARDILLCQTVGKTGYIYVVNSRGVAAVHPNPKVEGVSFMDRGFVRDQIKLKEGYLEYEWKNPGEHHERQKALYMAYFEPWDWIISVSSYREEFIELVKVADFRDSVLALRFGKTGYSFVLDSKGNLVIHPILKGKLLDVADPQGRAFVRTICEMKKGKLVYSWKNPGEKVFRDKVIVFDYIPEYDWIVASSYYLEESHAPLYKMRNIVFATVLGTLLLVLPTTLLMSGSILRPLKVLMNRFAAGKSGDLSVRMEAISKDEVGQLAGYFNDFMEKLENYRDSMQMEIRERKQTEEALRESEGKYRSILERMQEGYYELDMHGDFTFFNDSLSSILGYFGTELSGMNIREIADEENAKDILQALNMIKNSRKSTREARCELFKKDGSVCSVESSIALIENVNGQPVGFRGVLRDITQRKRSEEALRLSEEMFSKTFQCSPSGMLIATLQDGRVVNVNDSFLRYTGYATSEVKGKSLLDADFLFDEAFAADLLDEVSRKGRLSNQEIRFLTASGEARSGLVSADLVDLWGEKCILAALEDITDTKRLEREILEVSELEHRKIGRDLHDDLCPHLIGIEVLSKVLEQKLEIKSLTEAGDAEKIRLLIQDSIKKLRRLSRGLCPIDLEEEGFEESLASLGLYVEDIFGVTYHFQCDGPTNIKDETMATHLYYIAHEAVHNAVKHSKAKTISVRVAADDGTIVLTIKDDGQGIPEGYDSHGMGLSIMKYRARRIGATIEINQASDGGTLVTLRMRAEEPKVHLGRS